MIKTIPHKLFTDERGATVLYDYPEHKPTIVYSTCIKSTLKGLHFQTNPWVRKEVYLLEGRIYDVSVSLGHKLGEWSCEFFTAPAHFEIPVGYAHGLLALTDIKLIYKFDPYWDIQSTYSLLWNDSDVGIDWYAHHFVGKYDIDQFILSEKDKQGLPLTELKHRGLLI